VWRKRIEKIIGYFENDRENNLHTYIMRFDRHGRPTNSGGRAELVSTKALFSALHGTGGGLGGSAMNDAPWTIGRRPRPFHNRISANDDPRTNITLNQRKWRRRGAPCTEGSH
jgi:hypothetical protein